MCKLWYKWVYTGSFPNRQPGRCPTSSERIKGRMQDLSLSVQHILFHRSPFLQLSENAGWLQGACSSITSVYPTIRMVSFSRSHHSQSHQMAHGRKVGYSRRTDDKWQALLLIFHNNRRDQQLPWWSSARTNHSFPSRLGLPLSAPLWGMGSDPVEARLPDFPWMVSREHTQQNKNKSFVFSACPVPPKQAEMAKAVTRMSGRPEIGEGRKDNRGAHQKSASGDNGMDLASPQAGPFYMALFWLKIGKMSLLQRTSGHVSVAYGMIRSSSHWNWESWDFYQPALRRQLSSNKKFPLKSGGSGFSIF